MFETILQEIRRHGTIILHRHSSPDGDALGSQLGLREILRENFPQKTVYAVGDDSRYLSFLAPSGMDSIPDEAYTGALAIILDTGARSLISDSRYTLAAHTARIDHHIFAETIADTEVIDPSFESCCGMVTEFARSTGLRLNPAAAAALYTGMITDSGRFRYDNTNPRTLRLAALLLEQGIDTNAIYRNLYADTYESRRLKAQFTLKVQFTPKGVAYIYTTAEELSTIDADIFTVSRGMVGTMSDLKGVSIWANFTETASGVLCELRSAECNINPIAVKYGGGGHAKASGATLKDRAAAMAMLAELDAMIGGTKA
ncbi:MAG: bifunctional oligoribonuclease/PAP phosphatase NrnA [Clostridia bacterium]|nr:bifunctional oligoribonuclease/PAP phosphatase NrnA [Clostridia bacterium]